jgi:hypothetical protein
MELLNATNMTAGYTMGMKPSGREMLVVAVKGTFDIPANSGEEPRLAEQQPPLVEADTFSGEPGFSAPVYEVDYAPIKHRCDVLLNGYAYAPNGKPASKVQVGIKLAQMTKTFNVLGKRYWESGVTGIGPGYPGQFDRMPITYDNAYGGLDNFLKDESKHSAYMPNPVGKGYHRELDSDLVNQTPMPNTEALKDPIKKPYAKYQPMAFGPLGRGWQERLKYAGTYDDDWVENIFPFLPADFDERYYQAAPADQQIDYPRGGEEVMLVNLSPGGRCHFKLPVLEVPVVFFKKKGDREETRAVIDTIVLEPELNIFTLTWRAQIDLRKNIFEIPQVLVGKKSRAWWRARELGKTYYPSLSHLAEAKKVEIAEGDA